MDIFVVIIGIKEKHQQIKIKTRKKKRQEMNRVQLQQKIRRRGLLNRCMMAVIMFLLPL